MAEQFSPYVEEEHQRLTTQPISASLNSKALDHITQGVSVNDPRKRYGGTMPRIGAGPDDHVAPELVYGQSHIRNELVPFPEQDTLTGQSFIESDLASVAFATDEGFSKDGVMEPFVVRDEAEFRSIDQPFIARSVSAQLMDGNEDTTRASSRQTQNISLTLLSEYESFEDSSEFFADESGGRVAFPGYIFGPRESILPFDDKEYVRIDQKLTANDSEMNAILLQLSGSPQDNIVPPEHKVSSAGFTYFNNPIGTDSIAFGGTQRIASIDATSPNGFTAGSGGAIN